MKKAIIGLAVLAAVVGLRALVTRKGQKVREHCERMAAKCKQMMAEDAAESTEPVEPVAA